MIILVIKHGSNFEQGYSDWIKEGGYAGDILKFADQGGVKLTDSQYNQAITDANSFDWDQKMREDGASAGKSHANHNPNEMYDARVGGMTGNMKLSKTYSDWTNEDYMSNASVDARNTRAASANEGLNKVNTITGQPHQQYHNQNEQYKPEGYQYDPYSRRRK